MEEVKVVAEDVDKFLTKHGGQINAVVKDAALVIAVVNVRAGIEASVVAHIEAAVEEEVLATAKLLDGSEIAPGPLALK